jgi:uncharacterized protein (TIGR04255 family)
VIRQDQVVRPQDLPDFERPPLDQVAISVQFATLPGFTALVAGQLASRLPDFPEMSQQPTLLPTFEVFNAPGTLPPPITINFQLGPSFDGRYWFRTEDKQYLIQIQADRLILNWNRHPAANQFFEYPRYESLIGQFKDKFAVLSKFVSDRKLGEIKINQCEIAYVNIFALPDNSDPRSELQEMFKFWSNEYKDDQGLLLEDANISMRYPLKREGTPYGRLVVTVQPVVNRSDPLKFSIQFTLTVKGRPDNETEAAALEFFERGRSVIVKAFASLTRAKMHKEWGRIDV